MNFLKEILVLLKQKKWLVIVFLIVILPFNFVIAQEISLQDLSAFKMPADSWQIVGDVVVDPLVDGSFEVNSGEGVLVGSAASADDVSELEIHEPHGDVTIEFDVLLGHKASATVWLQGRYGIRLADSWKSKKLDISDNGTLIPSGTKGSGAIGHLANMNSARAPGTWQHVKIVFNAPRFDKQGSKIRNAQLVSMEHNGVVIHEHQSLAGPSQDSPFSEEAARGPLVFRISEGSIAIRNINYTIFSDEQVQLEDLDYELYVDKFLEDEFVYWSWSEDGKNADEIPIPDLNSRKPETTGKADLIHTEMAEGAGEDFTLLFNGKINLPKSGEYRFEVVPNGIGSFEINGNELFKWNAIHNWGDTEGSIQLEKGNHTFRLMNVNFRQPNIGLFVEGPGLKRQALHRGTVTKNEVLLPSFERGMAKPILLTPANDPLIQRSFMFHDGDKKLTTLSVGTPEGIHYTVNMATGGLMQVWRGPFADVKPMWRRRGEDQVLLPVGSVLSLSAEQQVLLNGTGEFKSGAYQRNGYSLAESGHPVFEYRIDSVHVRDHISINRKNPTLQRTLFFSIPNTSDQKQTIWYRLASAPLIERVSKQIYAVDDKRYFIQIDQNLKPVIKKRNKLQELLVPLQVGTKSEKLTYSFIW